jgi:RNA polymerase sigma-70 factor (ECF subfamily)
MFNTDHQLVRRCLQGEARAFDLLYDRHAPDVYRLLYRLAGEPTRAEDLTQETLIAAFRSLGNWQGRGTFRAWICGIAVRQFRHSQAAHYAADTAELEETLAATAPESDPLDYVTSRQARHLIEQAIGELPPIYREVFVLLRVEGWKQSEAAQVLDLPMGTVQGATYPALHSLTGLSNVWQHVGETKPY